MSEAKKTHEPKAEGGEAILEAQARRIEQMKAEGDAADTRIRELEKQLATLRAGISGLTDERDLARAERNTAVAKLKDLQRQMGRASQPTVGSSDMEGLGNLEQAIALCSAGNAR